MEDFINDFILIVLIISTFLFLISCNQDDYIIDYGINNNLVKFEKNESTLFFLQRIRDEAHRFAVSAHRVRRKKAN